MTTARDPSGPGPSPQSQRAGRRTRHPGRGDLPRRAGIQLAVALFLAACGSAPKESFYTLSAPAPVEAATAATFSVVVGPVSVPDSVDRTPMVIRTGPNQVDIADLHRWAEPLKAAIPRVLAAHLARELPGARVGASRQAAGGESDYRVAVDVSRFESSFSEGATLEAAWAISAKGGTVRGRTVAREAATPGDYAGLASAHSRALEKVAREIAAALRR